MTPLRRACSAAVITTLALMPSFASGREPLTAADLVLVPEPSLYSLTFNSYAFDKAATEAHYNEVFAGQTAADIVRLLEENDIFVRYKSPTRIGFSIDRVMLVFTYGASLNVDFEDGVFVKAEVFSFGAK